MPRPNSGPRLKLKKPKGNKRRIWYIVWYERGQRRERSTGAAQGSERAAQTALENFLASRTPRPDGPSAPHEMKVDDVLALYLDEHGATVVDADRIDHAIAALTPFWTGKPMSDAKGETCRRYYKWRRDALAKKFPERAKASPRAWDEKGPACFDGTIRRELGTLTAAAAYCCKEGYLTAEPGIWMPKTPPSRDVWLTRTAVAAMIWAARQPGTARGGIQSPKMKAKARLHLPLFILGGVYLGYRRDAGLTLQWTQNTEGGWVDLDRGIIDFNAVARRQTNKRRPIVPVPERLLRFLRYARQRTKRYVFEYEGKPVGSVKRSFATACRKGADLLRLRAADPRWEARAAEFLDAASRLDQADIHTLRHTAATFLMQAGTSIEDAGPFLGMSAETLKRTYWHHHPSFMAAAKEAAGRGARRVQ